MLITRFLIHSNLHLVQNLSIIHDVIMLSVTLTMCIYILNQIMSMGWYLCFLAVKSLSIHASGSLSPGSVFGPFWNHQWSGITCRLPLGLWAGRGGTIIGKGWLRVFNHASIWFLVTHLFTKVSCLAVLKPHAYTVWTFLAISFLLLHSLIKLP